MPETWSDEELKAAVAAYVDMHRKEAAGTPFVKKHYYDDLSERFSRTAKSYEYRMQNISYLYSLQGRQWVSGLKPARNVGVNVIRRLEKLIAEAEGQQLPGNAAFDAEVKQQREKQRQKAATTPPAGNSSPPKKATTSTAYQRDPEVVAWVLEAARGFCECCDNPAPFHREDGTPFLEVHHVQRLADGGPDVIENAVALCPNCHRELHFGVDKSVIAKRLRSKIARLV